jgi:hypothetical protein
MAQAMRQLHILGHDSHPLAMDGCQLGVLKHVHLQAGRLCNQGI